MSATVCELINLGTFNMCDVQIPAIDGEVVITHSVTGHSCERADGDFGPLLRGLWTFEHEGEGYQFTAE